MDARIEQMSQVLQGHGYKLTAARRAILESLIACGGHVSADALVDLVHSHSPSTGRMTVYRTLDLLAGLGLIRPVYGGTGAAHYVLLDSGHHHHLVCTGCDAVIEFDDCLLERIQEALGQRFDFQVQGHLLEFYGRCAACQ